MVNSNIHKMDIGLVITFITSYLQVMLYSILCSVFTYTSDAVLYVVAPTWVQVGDDDDGYMTDDDYELTERDNQVIALFDVNNNITPISIQVPPLNNKYVHIRLAFIANTISELHSDYVMRIDDIITNKLRCIMRIKNMVTLHDIEMVTGTTLEGYVVIVYETNSCELKEQIIDAKNKRELLTNKSVVFGMLAW